jgi:hypothetical protein
MPSSLLSSTPEYPAAFKPASRRCPPACCSIENQHYPSLVAMFPHKLTFMQNTPGPVWLNPSTNVMLKLLPWLPNAKFTNVYAHGWLPLKTTLPPESGQAVRLEESVVALMFAQGYCHWLAGAVKESERQVGVRSLKWAVALDAKARRARVDESILDGVCVCW